MKINTMALLAGLTLPAALASAQSDLQKQVQTSAPIIVQVDLRDAPRRLLHARLQIPVSPGALTLEYPRWIPGDHQPTGPIDNLAGLVVHAGEREIPWRRDNVDMYGIHVDVPAGTTQLDVSLDFLATAGFTGSDMTDSTSANMAVLEWAALILYPAHTPVAQIPIRASLTLPADWKFGTALTVTGQQDAKISFAPTTVEQLVDSPVLAGKYFHEFPLAPEITPKHYLDVAGDGPEDVELQPAFLASLAQLVRETGVLYASRHYDAYHFLLSLSDVVREEGLEHHQSSDNGVEKEGYSDPKTAMLNADLLPHEFTHSWNGKYRRPAGLATANYADPMKGDLLWVYEGMTQYWGEVLAARTGLLTPEEYRGELAWEAARLDEKPGRTWRSLEDTAIASQILRGETPAWANWRRGQDYYNEGALIWLDADTTIRQLTHNKKSLKDFCARFLGLGGNTPPRVVPYEFDEIVNDLNAVVPYDWRAFLTERLNSHAAHAPLAGIEHGGYKLVYGPEPSDYEQALLDHDKEVDAWFSAGFMVQTTGTIVDVRIHSPAYEVGLGPGTKLVAVNGRAFTPEVWKRSLRESRGRTEPIELIVSNDDQFRTLKLNYHDGERYPHLERVNGADDLLDEITKPLAPAIPKPVAPARGSGL